VYPASVYDPISSRMAENLGFEVGMFAGSIASSVILGAPDYILVTLTEFAEQVRRICRASNLPIMVDADHGYGNALNVKRTIEELEIAGVSAITIEDTLLPRQYGNSLPDIISIEEGVGKMRSALLGRKDSTLSIIARTSARSITCLSDTITRAKAYQDCGVDGIFLTGITEINDLIQIKKDVQIPILLGNAEPSLGDKDQLSQMGVKIALQGHIPYYAGMKKVYETMKQLKNGISPGELKQDILDKSTWDVFIQKNQYDQLIHDQL